MTPSAKKLNVLMFWFNEVYCHCLLASLANHCSIDCCLFSYLPDYLDLRFSEQSQLWVPCRKDTDCYLVSPSLLCIWYDNSGVHRTV